jgi:argininosuccinate lyase
LAGSGIPVDRIALKETLGFQAVSENALDATGDRDFVADMLYALTMIATHLSRLGGELVTYSSTEYGFIRLSDEFSTGSSLMPQKRNPDVFELARARAPRTLGSLVTMLATMHGLPAGYSKDLQEDKPQLFDAVDSMLTTMRAVRGAVQTIEPVPQRMAAALTDALFATDLADGMVAHGIPFREAHGIVGRLVAVAEAHGVSLRGVEKGIAQEVHPVLPELLEALGSFGDSVDRRVTAGGTSARSVLKQLETLERRLGPVD